MNDTKGISSAVPSCKNKVKSLFGLIFIELYGGTEDNAARTGWIKNGETH
ncbi:hypothetical protein [uncultured Ferrimonas sp.]|nr:hypothetical protein [uncultured Ferrimonas sp.]